LGGPPVESRPRAAKLVDGLEIDDAGRVAIRLIKLMAIHSASRSFYSGWPLVWPWSSRARYPGVEVKESDVKAREDEIDVVVSASKAVGCRIHMI
jgi:hypothetical protein